MPYPEYEQLADALVCFLFRTGGSNFERRASDTYAPLADEFGLSRAERVAPRPDGYSGSLWENRVQWTRQRLINHGYAVSGGRGVWRLTEKGVQRARSICGRPVSLPG